MKPTLFVLAAGMGSRYGGLKQLDGLGPNAARFLTMLPNVFRRYSLCKVAPTESMDTLAEDS